VVLFEDAIFDPQSTLAMNSVTALMTSHNIVNPKALRLA
jgi:hypothetical protein